MINERCDNGQNLLIERHDMVSPTEDKLPENSSASENDLDSENNAEGTSTSQPAEKEPSTFDVVMNAIKPVGEDDADDAESDKEASDKVEADKSKDGKAKDKEDEPDDPTEDELKLWKPKTRKRFENLQAKYRDVNERLEKAEVEAGNYRKFVDYLETNGLNQDEANNLFHIGALMKNDPFAALQAITPFYEQLLHVTGQVLPPDLKAQVDAGYLTQAHAVEISQGRAKSRVAPVITQEQHQRQQERENRQQGQNAAAMQRAVASWEQNWSRSDPDYASKKDRVLDRLELMLARATREKKLPQTVEQAVAMAEKARRDVEADFRQYKPKKPVSMVEGGSANSSYQSEAKDTRDVIRRTLNK